MGLGGQGGHTHPHPHSLWTSPHPPPAPVALGSPQPSFVEGPLPFPHNPEDCAAGVPYGGPQGAAQSPSHALEAPPSPSSRAPSLRPATAPLTPSDSLNGVCNRLGNPLQPLVQPPLGPPLRPLPFSLCRPPIWEAALWYSATLLRMACPTKVLWGATGLHAPPPPPCAAGPSRDQPSTQWTAVHRTPVLPPPPPLWHTGQPRQWLPPAPRRPSHRFVSARPPAHPLPPPPATVPPPPGVLRF